MRSVLKIIAAAWLSTASFSATNAAPVTIGSNEWYQVRDMTGVTWIDMFNACPLASSYQCSGTVNGHDLTGWTWASGTEVAAMFATVDPASVTNIDPWFSSWGDKLALTGMAMTYHNPTYLDVWSGWTHDAPAWDSGQVYAWINAGFTNQDGHDYTQYFYLPWSVTDPNIGAWLWRETTENSPLPCGALAPCPAEDIPADDPIDCGAAFPCAPTETPAPAGWALFGLGLAGLRLIRTRKRS
ncbi:MAG: hypothetical protein H3C28_07195 [Sphingomonadales bacterium]|nr:hypothetical protein [Sphingomonadales bacterium]